jgi:hypothetical protein
VKRDITWQDEFYDAGLRCDLADDSGVGRQRFDEYLKPDIRTRDVRVHIHPRCVTTITQMKRHQWEDHKKSLDKEQKQKAKDKDSDHPALWKYLMNSDPTYHGLRHCGQILRRKRRAA